MNIFKLQPTVRSAMRHLLHIVLSAFAVLLVTSGIAGAQSAGSQAAKLIGTIESDGFVGAVISDAKGEQTFYRLKEKLPDGSQIVKVRPNSISLIGADGTHYDMYISHETSAAASAVAPANSAANPAVTVNPNISGALRRPTNPATNPAVTVNPNTPGALRNSPTERPPSYYEKRRGRRKSDLDNE